jgi:hypothetical protein
MTSGQLRNPGLHHRIFPGEDQVAIGDSVTTELIGQGALFTDEDFKTLVLNEYLMRILVNDDVPLDIF